MIIKDPIFGEIEYDYIWSKDTTINFLGKETNISLIIKGDEDGKFEEEQYSAYNSLMQEWEKLQRSFLEHTLEYYQKKRKELGYDMEFNENFPAIETIDQLIENINLVGIVIPYSGSYEGRDIRLTFDCTWDNENGLGLRLLDEKVVEVGYQDVAI